MRFLSLFALFNCVFSYNIKLLPGSFVKPQVYKKLLDKVQNNLQEKNINITYNIINYFDAANKEENTTLICHSFGGYFGLLKCVKDRSGNIDYCILVNSHFNQRGKMPYPGIKLKDVNQNVLTILTKYDERLPLMKALDDVYVSNFEKIKNVDFIINNGTHFSSFDKDVNIVASQISNFIYVQEIIKGKKMRTMNDIYIHNKFFKFISSKPLENNQIFINTNENYIMYKTRNTDIDMHLKSLFTDTTKITWNKIYYNFSDDMNKSIVLKLIKVFQFLYLWLFKQPKVVKLGDKIYVDIFVFPISKSTVYYKFPYYV